MQSRIFNGIRSGMCLALLAACACTALAAPGEGADGPGAVRPAAGQAAVPGEAKTPAAAAPSDSLGFGPAADLGKLERSRGGTDTHNETNLSGIVTNNSAVNVVTGNNVIDAGSFANMSGIPVVIQNSGANVLIQNSTVVNLQMK